MPQTPKSAKLLIIDDDPDILSALSDALEIPNTKLDIATAKGGLEGLQIAKSTKPDIIILDLRMPDMDGFAVLDEIRLDPLLKHTKVIMLTANDSGRNLWEGIDRGLDDFISKPVDLGELEARIYAQLSR